MVSIEYTKQYDTDSSWIPLVWYNENTQTLWANLETEHADDVYEYKNVPVEAAEALAEASSVGAHYNQIFKKAYGPGVDIGGYWELHDRRVDVNTQSVITPALAQNEWTTTEVKHRGAATEVTEEHTLTSPEVKENAASNTKWRIVFDFNGSERTHEVAGDTVHEALAALGNLEAVLGVEFDVKEVSKIG